MDLPPGHVAGNYEVEALLQRIGLDARYRARHVGLDTRHALTVLADDTPWIRERFLLAARIQAAMRHPNVVAATDLVEADGRPALVLDHVEGPTLEDHVAVHGPLTVADADALMAGLVAALDHVHLRGAAHRDATPGNLLLRREGDGLIPMLTGFGIAMRFGADRPTPRGIVYGTPWYMPPEQTIDMDRVDTRVDVFAAAASAYFALTGRPPIAGDDGQSVVVAARRGEYTPIERLRPDLPARIVAAIRAGMHPDPGARLPDVRSLLTRWTDGAAPAALGAPPAPIGEVTLVFTDVQGSTAMWERAPEAMRRVLAAHDAVMRASLLRFGGHEVKTQGDAFMVAFHDPARAVGWCADVQAALESHPWPTEIASAPDEPAAVRVRMGVHVGRPECVPHPTTGAIDYFGPMVNCAARIQGAAHGGQILASADVAARIEALTGVRLRPRGAFALKGLSRPTAIVEIVPDALAHRELPPPAAEIAPSGG